MRIHFLISVHIFSIMGLFKSQTRIGMRFKTFESICISSNSLPLKLLPQANNKGDGMIFARSYQVTV